MTKKALVRACMTVALLAAAVFVSACSQTAGDEAMTGQAHERHATGVDSQVGDN